MSFGVFPDNISAFHWPHLPGGYKVYQQPGVFTITVVRVGESLPQVTGRADYLTARWDD